MSFDRFKHAKRVLDRDTLLTAALRYARRGWPVFPCWLDKTPMTANGFKDATTDAEQIRSWWERKPYAAIGMPTGQASGVDVLDVDCKDPAKDGYASLAKLEAKYGPLPPTRRHSTPSKGMHLLFKHTPGSTMTHGFRLGLDWKSDGGYVILPPSFAVYRGIAGSYSRLTA